MQPFIQVGHGNTSSPYLEDWSQTKRCDNDNPKDAQMTIKRCANDNQKMLQRQSSDYDNQKI